MARALHLTLDRDDRTYRPGEALAGRVEVESDRDLDCHELEVWLSSTVEGRAPAERAETPREVIFRGHVPPGGHTARFRLDAPAGPLTHAGALIRIGWRVHARAVLDLRADLHAEEEIRLVPWRADAGGEGYRGALEAPLVSYDQGPAGLPQPAPPPLVAGGLGPAIAGLSGAGLLFASMVGAVIAISTGAVAATVGAAVAAAAGAGALVARERARRARTLGAVELSVSPAEVEPGAGVAVTLRITPARAAVLPQLTLALMGEEVAAVHGESDGEAHHVELFAEQRPRREVRLAAGEELVITELFALPEGAVPSYCGRFNELRWEARAVLRLPGGDEWRHGVRVVVAPPRAP